MSIIKFIFAVVISMMIATSVNAKDLKVVFINPGHPKGDETGPFWADVSRFMRAASDDLNIELLTLYANRNHILMKKLAARVKQHSPDYVVIVNEKGVGLTMLQSLTAAQLPVFTLLNSLSQSDLAQLTSQQSKLYIGSLVPDNVKAGKHLMESLLKRHLALKLNQPKLNVLALQGDYRSAAGVDRFEGMQQALKTSVNVELIDSTTANWSQRQAYEIVSGLIKRNQIDIIWAANDPMALGARQAVKQANLNYPVTIGGFNWDEVNSTLPLDVSFGGHVTLGVKALAMIKDYHRGLMSSCEMHTKIDIFLSSEEQNLPLFLANTQDTNIEQFDFSRFSKLHPNTAYFHLDSFISKRYQPNNAPNHKKPCN